MNIVNIPGFSAGTSLQRASGGYGMHWRGAAPTVVTPQLKCFCPPGLLRKAITHCPNPAHGGEWCDVADSCLDCFG
jgi:hypothetical protein